MNDDSTIAMPFVTVASKGGPHDDQAYTCGYEMGYLDATLDALSQAGQVTSWTVTIHRENIGQADLIGMQYNLTMSVGEWTDPSVDDRVREEWAPVRFDWPELETEPDELVSLFAVSLRRLVPVGLVYLWPTTSL